MCCLSDVSESEDIATAAATTAVDDTNKGGFDAAFQVCCTCTCMYSTFQPQCTDQVFESLPFCVCRDSKKDQLHSKGWSPWVCGRSPDHTRTCIMYMYMYVHICTMNIYS